jgi:hypothetical protein
MYTYAKGPIPPGYVVGHECDTPPCCNPDHLKAITELENSADMIAKGRNYEQQRTHCPKGHPYSGDNVYFLPAKSGRPARRCRECERIKSRRRWHTQPHVRERQRELRALRRLEEKSNAR